MQITHELRENALIILFSGELDHHASHEAILDITEQISMNRGKTVELNLAGMTFMDSSGLAVAINAKRAADRCGVKLTISNTPAYAMKIFRAAQLEKMISFA